MGSSGDYTYQYALNLTNPSNYDFYDWEAVISPFNVNTMTVVSHWNFNYVIKNGTMVVFGNNLANHTTLGAGFQIRYTASIPTLTVSNFIGKALILS